MGLDDIHAVKTSSTLKPHGNIPECISLSNANNSDIESDMNLSVMNEDPVKYNEKETNQQTSKKKTKIDTSIINKNVTTNKRSFCSFTGVKLYDSLENLTNQR